MACDRAQMRLEYGCLHVPQQWNGSTGPSVNALGREYGIPYTKGMPTGHCEERDWAVLFL